MSQAVFEGRTDVEHAPRGREARYRTDYILGTDSHLIHNMSVWYAQYNTYHYLVLGCLHRDAPDKHSRYLRKWKHFILNSPKTPGGVNRQFA